MSPLDELINLLPETGKISLERTEKGNLVILVTQADEKYFLLIEEPAPAVGQSAQATLFGQIPNQTQTSFKNISAVCLPQEDPELPSELNLTLPSGQEFKIGPLKKAALIPPTLFLQKCGVACPLGKSPQEAIADFLSQKQPS